MQTRFNSNFFPITFGSIKRGTLIIQ
jgi:hypothetical protein